MMTMRKLTLVGAALAGVMLAASAGANDQYRSSERSPMAPERAVTTPTSPNESSARVREPRDPIGRGDNPNLPNPVTPSAANESAPQPRSAKEEPTNQPGIPPYPVGGTR
jgi:hypothetical protein